MLPRLSHDSGSLLNKESRCSSPISTTSADSSKSKSVAELIKEIATLEVEVMNLECHLLSLYRIAFERQLSTLPSVSPFCYEDTDSSTFINNIMKPPEVESQKDTLSPKETFERDLKNNDSGGLCRLADHFGAPLFDVVCETPDKLSEEIVMCISSIYFKLSKPHETLIDSSLSPTSTFSSLNASMPKSHYDDWSPQCSEEATVYPCQRKGSNYKNPVVAETIDIWQICLDDDSFDYAAKILQNFRSLIQRLEKVDPRMLKHKQKLAFWINIHNALMMHAFLAYGTHKNRVRNACLIQKAAYNIGGHSINPFVIQCSILGCHPRHSTSWLETFLFLGAKPQSTSCKHVYALDYPEPLVNFALCSGAYSDPMVKAYTAKNVFQELNVAKDEFIQANVSIKKGRKVMLPKVLYYYAKDASLNLYGVMELVHSSLSEAEQQAIETCVNGRPDKYIEWSPYNSRFRYRIHAQLYKGRAFV